MLKNALAFLVALLVGLLVVVAVQPSTYRVAMSRMIDAPPEVVFDQLDDFASWRTWSPWDDRDPAAEVEIGGAPAGVGAWYTWAGNRDVGKGRMEIVESKPPTRIRWHLQFFEPFKDQSETWMDLEAVDGGTMVSWVMVGDLDFFGRAFNLVAPFSEMIGADFQEGLERLDRRVAEGLAEREAEAEAHEAAPHEHAEGPGGAAGDDAEAAEGDEVDADEAEVAPDAAAAEAAE